MGKERYRRASPTLPWSMRRGLLAMLLLVVVALWIISYPLVLGDTTRSTTVDHFGEAEFPPQPSPTRGLALERLQGRTLAFRWSSTNNAYLLILWKGSFHFQKRALSDPRCSGGLNVIETAMVMSNAVEGASPVQQLYLTDVTINWLGFGIVPHSHPADSLQQAIAIPLWPLIAGVTGYLAFRLTKAAITRKRHGFVPFLEHDRQSSELRPPPSQTTAPDPGEERFLSSIVPDSPGAARKKARDAIGGMRCQG